MNRVFFALSLAKKSGKLVCGFDSVKESVINGTAKAVFTTDDASEKTVKRLKTFCQDKVEIYTLPLTQYEVSHITNKLTAVFAIADENMALLCKNAIKSEKESN